MPHALERTSPKGPGQKFIGRCTQCGAEGLTPKQIWEDCPNPANFAQSESLLRAIKGDDNEAE